ncbi:MAG: ABC transporter permease [Methanomicrobiales archaeon]|jgi:lipopolysaccharide transport system permease protein|nr:ABC transporter permease [Methanomicrobiales archaeon]
MWLTKYRELIWVLAVNQLRVKYKNSLLGIAWSFISPLLMMLVLYFVFVNIFERTQDNYAIYVLSGLISWRFFSITTSVAMTSVVKKSSLINKIYFPRQIIIFSSVLASAISYMIEVAVLLILIIILGPGITWTAIFFPVILALYFVISYGVSLILAALYVFYRDINQIWGVITQVMFFLTPVIYPMSRLSKFPKEFLDIYFLNPFTAVMVAIRDCLLYGIVPGLDTILVILVAALVFLIAGHVVFSRLEWRFAEEA